MTQRTKTSNGTNKRSNAAKVQKPDPQVARGRRATSAEPTSKPTSKPTSTEGLEGALRALSLALDKKALEPVLLDVRSLCSFTNYQLLLSGRSDRQVDAIADGIEGALKAEGIRVLSAEGARTGQWALLDYGDFVIHVFVHSAREHYDLEGLWNDAPRVPIEVPPDARVAAEDPYEAQTLQ